MGKEHSKSKVNETGASGDARKAMEARRAGVECMMVEKIGYDSKGARSHSALQANVRNLHYTL